MFNILASLAIVVLLAIVVRLVNKTAQQSATIARQESTIANYESQLADYVSAIGEWIDYADNLKDRLHGVDSYPLPSIESEELPLFVFGDGSGVVKDIATHNLGGYALPANETSPAKNNGNGNGHKDGKRNGNGKDGKNAESKYTSILGKLGKLDSSQQDRAIALLDKWYGKDGKNAESKAEEYLKRLQGALKS